MKEGVAVAGVLDVSGSRGAVLGDLFICLPPELAEFRSFA
jgi:hypothetical protein